MKDWLSGVVFGFIVGVIFGMLYVTSNCPKVLGAYICVFR